MQMAGSGQVNRLTAADPRQLDTPALHARVRKQHATQRSRTQMRQLLQFTTQGCHGNNGTRIDPGLAITQQVHLPDDRQATLLHSQHTCFIYPRGPPGLRQYPHLEFSRTQPLQAQGQ